MSKSKVRNVSETTLFQGSVKIYITVQKQHTFNCEVSLGWLMCWNAVTIMGL